MNRREAIKAMPLAVAAVAVAGQVANTTSEMTGSEAVYGFAAWLTTRDEPITMGASYDASAVASLVAEFCRVNNLAPPRDVWPANLTHPEIEVAA